MINMNKNKINQITFILTAFLLTYFCIKTIQLGLMLF